MTNARAVCNHNVTAMRAEPSRRAERVSEVLFGETVTLVGAEGEFSQIQSDDSYSGWILSQHLVVLETGERYPKPDHAALTAPLFLPVFQEPSGRSQRITLLTLGSVVELASGEASEEFLPIRFPNGEIGYLDGSALIVPTYPPLMNLGPNLVVVAKGLIGVPYLWGGRTPFGLDCSGFTQRAFALNGVIIPRDAYQQAQWKGVREAERHSLQPGDLVFFASKEDPRGRGITHVGLALGDGRFIHASGDFGVTINRLDDEPYHQEYYGARRTNSTTIGHIGDGDGAV